MIACKSQAALARQRCRIHTVREGVARCPLPSSSGGTSAESVEASKYNRVDQKPVTTKLFLTRSGDDRNVRSASRIALLRPGDLFICSGGVAHATLSVVAQVKGRAEAEAAQEAESFRGVEGRERHGLRVIGLLASKARCRSEGKRREGKRSLREPSSKPKLVEAACLAACIAITLTACARACAAESSAMRPTSRVTHTRSSQAGSCGMLYDRATSLAAVIGLPFMKVRNQPKHSPQ